MNKKYNCQWCKNEFSQFVTYKGNDKKGAVSSQVKCPNCLNFIPTWKKEKTGNSTGKKHIHLGRGV